MAIPPGQSEATLTAAVQSLASDVYGFQEVDHFLPRSGARPQMRDIAEALGHAPLGDGAKCDWHPRRKLAKKT
jgi:hypothetical protein